MKERWKVDREDELQSLVLDVVAVPSRGGEMHQLSLPHPEIPQPILADLMKNSVIKFT